MTVLTKEHILTRIQEGTLKISPQVDNFQLQSHSVDLRLGYTFMVPRTWHITPQGRVSLEISHFDNPKPEHFEIVELEKGQYFELLPGEYILVSTLETVGIPNDLMAVLYPRSSTNRKGLSVDLTGIVDAGYEGQLIIPLRNNTQSQITRLYPGERLCQLVFEELSSEIEPRKSKYHQRDVIEGVRKETFEEAELIKTGNISDLKKNYPAQN
jgi:dCTP deaminase